MRTIRRLLCVSFVLSSFVAPGYATVIGTVINIDGKPLAGAKVLLFAQELIAARWSRLLNAEPQRTPLATVSTDSNGRFSIEVPKEQPVADVRVEAGGYAPLEDRFAADDDAGAMLLTAASSVRGTITANGKPVANATVVFLGTAEYTTRTDAEGRYSAPDPAKWASRVLVLHSDFAFVDEPILPFGAKNRADFTMIAGVSINGRVVGDDGQTPAGDVPIFLDGWPVARSAADGTFTIAHARKAWNTVEALSGNLIAQRVRAGAGPATLKLTKGAMISGSVRDVKSQLPVAGARVAIAQTGRSHEVIFDAVTDAKGTYTLTPIAGSTYDVRPSRPGYDIKGAQAVSVKGAASVQKLLFASAHGRVSGSVVDDNKRPVFAAKLSTRALARDNGILSLLRGGRVSEGYSAPDGHFVLRNVESDADLQIDGVKRGFPAGKSPSFKLAAGERKNGVIVTIPLGLAITGRVTDNDRKPLSGASVEAIESSGDPQAGMRRLLTSLMQGGRNDEPVRTGSDGTFAIHLKEGTYDLVFKREGYSAKTLRGTKADSTTRPVEVMLDPGVEISGRVMRSGAGVEGIPVLAMTEDSLAIAMTVSDGSFRIADLTPGPKMLMVSKPELFIQETRPATAPAQNFVIELSPGGRITGRVIDKMTHRPVVSFLAGVAIPQGGGAAMPPMQKQFTADDGTFVLENVRSGSTQVVVNAPGYIAARSPNVNVEDGRTVQDVELEVETGAKLTGRVTGPDETPIAGVTVRNIVRTADPRRIDTAEDGPTTDANGEYTIESLEPGEKMFRFSRTGYVTQQKTVTISPGKDARLDVQIANGMRATGLVVTDGGVPIPDASVRTVSGNEIDGSREDRTDAGGAFTIEGLAPGRYMFMASKNGFAPATLPDVEIPTSGPVRVILKSGGVITGHVNGLTAKELDQTTVYAGVSGSGPLSAPVDGAGNFRMEGVPPGTVRIGARTGVVFGGSSRSAAPKTVDFDGGTAQVEIDFQSGALIRGRITRNGSPIASAQVIFIPRGGKSQTAAGASADADGRYELSGLDDGTYSVRITDIALMAPFTTQYEVHGSDTFDITIKTVTVRGHVADAADSRPLSDASVELRIAGQPAFGARNAQTDPSGNFVLENVAAGTYQIAADKPGYGREAREITIGDSAPEEVQIKLSASQH